MSTQQTTVGEYVMYIRRTSINLLTVNDDRLTMKDDDDDVENRPEDNESRRTITNDNIKLGISLYTFPAMH